MEETETEMGAIILREIIYNCLEVKCCFEEDSLEKLGVIILRGRRREIIYNCLEGVLESSNEEPLGSFFIPFKKSYCKQLVISF